MTEPDRTPRTQGQWATLADIEATGLALPAPVVALGMFDGVHRGHQAIIRRAVHMAEAIGGTPVVFTFDRHPSEVLAGRPPVPRLTDLEERLELFFAAGAAFAVVAAFDAAFSRIEASRFIADVLVGAIGARGVVCGFDFRFGRHAQGTPALLQEEGRCLGFSVDVVDPVVVDGLTVSSTEIRRRVAEGDMETAAALLGRPYRLRGRVVPGRGQGRQLGFPTANVDVPAGAQWPGDGVYAADVSWRGADGMTVECPALAVISTRPTFGEHPRALEVHIPDFDGNLYGLVLSVAFHRRLRPIIPFPDVDALVRQMEADVAQLRAASRP